MSGDREFMSRAIELARSAGELGEVPVGAVIVKDKKIIASAFNRRESEQSVLCHAEIQAISGACKSLNSWRLCGCEMFVTLEPCDMCLGAISQARIERVVFGAYREDKGRTDCAAGGICVVGGYMKRQCAELLTAFFEGKRQKEQPFK